MCSLVYSVMHTPYLLLSGVVTLPVQHSHVKWHRSRSKGWRDSALQCIIQSRCTWTLFKFAQAPRASSFGRACFRAQSAAKRAESHK